MNEMRVFGVSENEMSYAEPMSPLYVDCLVVLSSSSAAWQQNFDIMTYTDSPETSGGLPTSGGQPRVVNLGLSTSGGLT